MGIFHGIERFGARTAVITETGEGVDYWDFTAMADAVGTRLPGRCLVLQVCRNDLAALAGYVGLQRAGAVTMLVNHKIKPHALHGLVEAFRPAYLYLPSAMAATLGGVTGIHCLDDFLLVATGATIDYALHDDLALLLGTSGSTGSPDQVRISRTNLNANTRSIIQYLGIAESDRAITTMPMSYSYGLSIINTHLHAGGAIIATEATLMQRRFWELANRARATTFGGVPFVYQMLKRLGFAEKELPGLRYITQAGGRLDADSVRAFGQVCRDKGIRFYVMYGQTEATARIAYVPAEQAIEKAGSVGIPIPGGRIWLADEDGTPVTGAGAAGEIVYEGDNVSMGYARDRHGLGGADQRHGVLFTGDIARRDADGYHYLLGRKSRFLKLFGHRIGLDQLEQTLQAAGVECVAAGHDDHLVIYTTETGADAAIHQVLSRQTGITRQGYRVRVIDALPRNDAGKVQYARLPVD